MLHWYSKFTIYIYRRKIDKLIILLSSQFEDFNKYLESSAFSSKDGTTSIALSLEIGSTAVNFLSLFQAFVMLDSSFSFLSFI